MNERERNTAAVLDRAIELLHAGWCRDGFAENADGRPVHWNGVEGEPAAYCAEGALLAARRQLGLLHEPVDADRIAIRAAQEQGLLCEHSLAAHPTPMTCGGRHTLATVNDDPDTTKEDVLLLFKKARATLE